MRLAVVLDTSFLIDVADGDQAARDLADRFAADHELLLIPTVVVAEYLAGSSDPDADVDTLRGAGEVIELTTADARQAAQVARSTLEEGTFPGWSDVLITGVAENRGGLVIVTGNADHFPTAETVTYG